MYSLTFPSNGLQNDDEGLALCYANTTLIQFLSYEGTFMASGDCAGRRDLDGYRVSESSSTPTGESLQLTGTGSDYGDFNWTGPTTDSPGAVNASQTLESRPVTNTDTGESFSTIQAAIDAAGPGAEIEVSGGPFEETVTIDVEGLTLRGVGTGGGFPSQGAPTGAPIIIGQSQSAVEIEANDVTVEGFDIRNPVGRGSGSSGLIGILVGFFQGSATDATIKNNTINNMGTERQRAGALGVLLENTTDGATIEDNIIKNITDLLEVQEEQPASEWPHNFQIQEEFPQFLSTIKNNDDQKYIRHRNKQSYSCVCYWNSDHY